MTPEAYLEQYLAPLRTRETSGFTLVSDSILASGYYYPPWQLRETYLDLLNLSSLIQVIQGLLASDYPEQRLTRRHAIEYRESMQQARSELAWRRPEMDRLARDLAQCKTDLAQCETDLAQCETDGASLEAELMSHKAQLELDQARLAQMENENAMLCANLADVHQSTSWRVTSPLRRLSRVFKALRDPAG